MELKIAVSGYMLIRSIVPFVFLAVLFAIDLQIKVLSIFNGHYDQHHLFTQSKLSANNCSSRKKDNKRVYINVIELPFSCYDSDMMMLIARESYHWTHQSWVIYILTLLEAFCVFWDDTSVNWMPIHTQQYYRIPFCMLITNATSSLVFA